jgi:hypothetical protein
MPAQPYHERIADADFRRAVDLVDEGDADGLRAWLNEHPDLVHRRMDFEGNYFRNPTLLEFVGENPIRRARLPANAAGVAKVILDAGAREDRAAMNGALQLVASGRVPRECRVQVPLIDLLCDHGADPDTAMHAALAHGEFEAVDALIQNGAHVDAAVAAGLGRVDELRGLLGAADGESRQWALAMAAQFGHTEAVRLLLNAGADPNRYNPAGAHAHSTPLHQAAFRGHEGVVRLLVERGARLDILDTTWQGTPAGWARHGGKTAIEEYLEGLER